MRFSLITTALALSLTVSASQVDRRELNQSATKCITYLKAVGDYLPIFTESIEKITSYSSAIDAHIKEDNVAKKIRKALKECKKVTSASSEQTVAFTVILEPIIENILEVSDALVKKKDAIVDIPLARPLLEDSLRTIYKDTKGLEDDLVKLCPEGHMETFKTYIDNLNDAFEKVFKAFDMDK